MEEAIKKMRKVLEEMDGNADKCCELISQKFGDLIEKLKEREKGLIN